MATHEVFGETYDFETITVADSAIGFTAAKLYPTGEAPCRRVMATLETAAVRYRMDGTDPTGDVGHLLNVADVLHVVGINDLLNFRAFRDTGSSGSLSVSYMR